jgi:thiol-disulfide isomerase/thioredoxin
MRAGLVRPILVLLIASVFGCSTVASAQAAASPPAPPVSADPHFLSALNAAKTLEARREPELAIASYRKANKIAGGTCTECLRRSYSLDLEIHDYKEAAETAGLIVQAATSARERSQAEFLQGSALYQGGGENPKPDKLKAVDEALQAAIADDSKNVSARFIEGQVLARLGRLDEAKAQFESCVAQISPKDPYYARAKHFAEDPTLSYQKRAPAFIVTALDGSKFALDDMGGRVVLIDFWATWCGPCNEELPYIKKIAKEFAGQPFVIISVSWDDDAAKWKDFIAKNEMTWVQYRDADHSLSKRFGIDAIPHYFTIDSDGVLTSEMLGSGSDVEGKLKKLVARAKAAQAASSEVAGGE